VGCKRVRSPNGDEFPQGDLVTAVVEPHSVQGRCAAVDGRTADAQARELRCTGLRLAWVNSASGESSSRSISTWSWVLPSVGGITTPMPAGPRQRAAAQGQLLAVDQAMHTHQAPGRCRPRGVRVDLTPFGVRRERACGGVGCWDVDADGYAEVDGLAQPRDGILVAESSNATVKSAAATRCCSDSRARPCRARVACARREIELRIGRRQRITSVDAAFGQLQILADIQPRR